MRQPKWIHVSNARKHDNHVVVNITINRRHPGFWLHCYRQLRERGYGRLVSMRAVLRTMKARPF